MAQEKILIIDDDKLLLKAIELGLRKEQMITYSVSGGTEALTMLQNATYDAILLDFQMPDIDGLELIQFMRSHQIYTPVIMISGREEEHHKILALGMGADDYLTKPFSIHLLHSKLKALIRRNSGYQQTAQPILTVGPFRLDKHNLEIFKDGTRLELTSKETMLLKFFLENPNRVYTKAQLYEMVWKDCVVDDNTIMVYVKRLRQKIEVNPKSPEYLMTVWGIGYQFHA